MVDFIQTLEFEFNKNANAEIAVGQKAYMRNQFEFLGIQSPVRRLIQNPFLVKEYLPVKSDLHDIVKTLWGKDEREYQYFSQELVYKHAKQFVKRDIELFEFMIAHKPWWDTIDFIAPKLVGEYFKVFPDQRDRYVEKWIASNNIWFQRTSIIFQLNYKEELDKEFLTYVINSLTGSKEFFINKAIGWILRQYSKTNSGWVMDFASKAPLDKLSRREAMRLIS